MDQCYASHMRAQIAPWIIVISTVFSGGSVACTAAQPPAATSAQPSNATPLGPEGERLSTTDEKTAPVSESTMSAPMNKAATSANNALAEGEPAPAGQLVCRANADGNAQQIFLEWNGDTAKGTLRTSTPSGMVRQEPIKAERYKARIIIDDPSSDDVAVHKATLVEDRKGKHIQLGDHTRPWTNCN